MRLRAVNQSFSIFAEIKELLIETLEPIGYDRTTVTEQAPFSGHDVALFRDKRRIAFSYDGLSRVFTLYLHEDYTSADAPTRGIAAAEMPRDGPWPIELVSQTIAVFRKAIEELAEEEHPRNK